MRYILCEDVALRSWLLVPRACYKKQLRNAMGLTEEEFSFLLKCDGRTDIAQPVPTGLLNRGLCRPAQEGDRLTAWQTYKAYDNRYFPAMNWMITGRCNYNCLHCFNAADNAHLQSEFTMEEAAQLIAQAEECGIHAFTITGGEPMAHPHFMEIIRSIYAHNMYVEELNTNGFFLTESILKEMQALGAKPLMKISFDGLGHHDWLRNHQGAQQEAVRAIKLCVSMNFPVMVQTNIHRKNVDSLMETALFLQEIGVATMRIIRTSESPRWRANAGDSCLSWQEYFDKTLEFLTQYRKTPCTMGIVVWQFLDMDPVTKTYAPKAVECSAGCYRDSLPVCRGNRGMVAVAADGNLYPCHQMSGYYMLHGDVLGNVKKEGLAGYLRGGKYLEEVCTTVRTLQAHNETCRDCKWFFYCCGGCRALGLAATGDKLGSDPSKCLFFRGGYLEKTAKALMGYTCKKHIEI